MSSGPELQGVGEEAVAVGETEDIPGGGGGPLLHGASEGTPSHGRVWRLSRICQ